MEPRYLAITAVILAVLVGVVIYYRSRRSGTGKEGYAPPPSVRPTAPTGYGPPVDPARFLTTIVEEPDPLFDTPWYLTQYEHQDHIRDRYEAAMDGVVDKATVPWPVVETTTTARYTLERERPNAYSAPAAEASRIPCGF